MQIQFSKFILVVGDLFFPEAKYGCILGLLRAWFALSDSIQCKIDYLE
jgi:hypothetical protein